MKIFGSFLNFLFVYFSEKMSIFALASNIQRLTSFLIPKCYQQISALHTMSKNFPVMMKSQFLEPVKTEFCPTRGMKHKRVLKLRCKDCYFQTIDDILHVKCKTHGRHKQMRKPKKARNLYMITSISTGPRRPW